MNFSIFVCLVLGAEWRGLKPECGWLPGPLWLRLAQAVARWPEPWTGPGQSWSVSHSQGWPAGWLRLRAGSSLCQQGSQSLRLRSERRRSEPGSPPPRSPPDQCNKLMCTPHSGWAQAGMAWGGGGEAASCVCCNTGQSHGCWDSLQIQAELLVIQTFRAITDSRFKIKAKSTAYLYPEPGEARPGTTGGIT